jgi:uncharacterized repeat protein (TIGR02543 family)
MPPTQFVPQWLVFFDLGGGTGPSDFTTVPRSVGQGSLLVKPTDPTKAGSTFGGWWNEDFTVQWNFATDTVTEDITLYAKWN